MIKRIFCILTALAMLAPAAVFADEENNTYETNKTEIEFLISAQLADGKENKADYDAAMTSKEFRDILKNLGITDEQLREIDAFGINYTAKGTVTRSDAAVPLVKLIGYDAQAINKGGYEKGYIAVASSLGFFKGLSTKSGEALTRGEVYRVVYNAINAPIYPDIIFPGEHYVDDELTFLTEKLSIYKLEGVVTSTERSAAAGYTKAYSGRFKIGKMDISASGKNIDEYFASSVEAYCRYNEDDDEYSLVTIDYQRKNTKTVIKAQDIISYDNYIYTFDDVKRGRSSDEKISPLTEIVYNGTGITASNASIVNMKPDNGSVILIDNTGDGKIDMALINDYEIACVDEVKTEDRIVLTKNIGGISQKRLDLDNTELYSSNGVAFDISALGEWNILNLAKNGYGGYEYAIVSTESKTGFVSSHTEDYGYTELQLRDNTLLDIVPGLLNTSEEVDKVFDSSNEYAFFLTADGAVGAYRLLVNASYFVAYLGEVKYYIDEDTDDEILRIKAFDVSTESGITLFAAEKCSIEGVRTSLKDIADEMCDEDGYAKDCLFRYKLNSKSEVVDIDMPSENNLSLEPNSDGGLIRIANAPVVDSTTGARRIGYQRNTSFILRDAGGRGWIEGFPYRSEHTHIFVPGDRAKVDDYYLATKYRDAQIVYEAYRIEGESEVPTIIIEFAGNGSPERESGDEFTNNTNLISDDAEMYIVKDITNKINEDDELEYTLKLLGRKGEVEYTLDNSKMLSMLKISKGCIIRFAVNAYDRIIAADVVISSDNLKPGDNWYVYTQSLNTNRGIFGLAYKVYDDSIAMALKNPGEGLAWNDIAYINTSDIKLYVYDADKKTVEEGSIADVNTYYSNGYETASRVFLNSSSGGGRMIIVFNGLKN